MVKTQRARSDEEKQEVRERLIEATRDLLTKGEFQNQGMRQIAAYAGYTTGIVYHYFSNKADLLHAVRDIEISRLEAECLSRLALSQEPELRLRKHIEFLRIFTQEMMGLYGASFLSGASETRSNNGGLKPYMQQVDPSPASGRMHRLADKLLKDFFDSLPSHPAPIEVAADSLWGAINSTFTMAGASAHRPWSDPARVGEEVLDALMMMWKDKAKFEVRKS